jgi:hypothetical protein
MNERRERLGVVRQVGPEEKVVLIRLCQAEIDPATVPPSPLPSGVYPLGSLSRRLRQKKCGNYPCFLATAIGKPMISVGLFGQGRLRSGDW